MLASTVGLGTRCCWDEHGSIHRFTGRKLIFGGDTVLGFFFFGGGGGGGGLILP